MTLFKAFRQFNTVDPEESRIVGSRGRLDPRFMTWIDGDTLYGRIVQELANRRALPIKEVMESFEFFERTRSRVRHRFLADLCCGHGLTGMLFAAAERQVEEVILLDRAAHPNQQLTLEAVAEVAPWVRDKVRFVKSRLDFAHLELRPNGGILALHACGRRTDQCIDLAIQFGGSLAAMPCCYAMSAVKAPQAIARYLGPELASDVHRSYRLEAANYQVQWRHIPEQITPMNRILLATARRPAGLDGELSNTIDGTNPNDE